MSGEPKIHVGSRKSELALVQTRHVIALLKQLHPDKDFEIVTMSTLGDKILDIPLPKIGEKSLFTQELEIALASKRVDFVVHSLKDLPTTLPDGMAIGAVLSREDPRDALVLQKGLNNYSLATLPENSVIGTSSLRRTAQLAKKYSHLKVENIRGNLNTRLKKLDDLGTYQAIILASAGLIRIGWKNRISKMLDSEEFLYAVGQGALAVECRENDENIIKLLEPLYDLQTALRIIAERSFLKTLGGGCSAPVAVTSNLILIKEKEVELSLKGAVWSLDGKEEVLDNAKTQLNVLDSIKCAECPYKNGFIEIIDIECCISCPVSPNKMPPAKKTRLNITKELLENDPHEKCPMQLPIGLDFMGQCPYLEGDLQTIHNHLPLDGSPAEIKKIAQECPYLKQTTERLNNIVSAPSVSIENNNSNLFVGLVSHKSITKENLKKAQILGENLARNLIQKGALDIMSKAQAIVHGGTKVKT